MGSSGCVARLLDTVGERVAAEPEGINRGKQWVMIAGAGIPPIKGIAGVEVSA